MVMGLWGHYLANIRNIIIECKTLMIIIIIKMITLVIISNEEDDNYDFISSNSSLALRKHVTSHYLLSIIVSCTTDLHGCSSPKTSVGLQERALTSMLSPQ